MPWSYPKNVPSVAKNWTPDQQQKCVKAANAVLRDTGDDQKAIFACIRAAGKSTKTKGSNDVANELASKEADKNAQKRRSVRYGISVREDGNVTKPKQWASLRDSQFGDPVNYLYPVPDKAHAANAKSRFQQNKGAYDSKSQGVVRSRLNRLLRKFGLAPIGEETKKNSMAAGAVTDQTIQMMAPVSIVQLADDDPPLFHIPAVRNASLNHPWFGTLHFDADFFDSVIDNFASDVAGHELAINPNHDRSAGALAWIKDLVIEGDDKSLVIVAEPTEPGLKAVQDKIFKYASIEYHPNFTDQETGINYGPTLLGAALTNHPFVHRQKQVAMLADDIDLQEFFSEGGDSEGDTPPIIIMYGGTDMSGKKEAPPEPGLQDIDDIDLEDEESNVTPPEPKPAPTAKPAPKAGPQLATTTASGSVVVKSIQIGDLVLTEADVKNLISRQQADARRLHEAEVNKVYNEALARGVPPILLEMVKQIMLQADMDARPTIRLEVPTEDGQGRNETFVNLFGALSQLLRQAPGRIGDEVTWNFEKKILKDKPTNPYLQHNPNMTVEEAEELARQDRKRLNIAAASAADVQA